MFQHNNKPFVIGVAGGSGSGKSTVTRQELASIGPDMAAVGAVQIAAELEIIGRIGEDEIDTGGGQRAHCFDAIARQDTAQRQIGCARSFLRFYNAFRARLHLLYHTHRVALVCHVRNLSTGMSL